MIILNGCEQWKGASFSNKWWLKLRTVSRQLDALFFFHWLRCNLGRFIDNKNSIWPKLPSRFQMLHISIRNSPAVRSQSEESSRALAPEHLCCSHVKTPQTKNTSVILTHSNDQSCCRITIIRKIHISCPLCNISCNDRLPCHPVFSLKFIHIRLFYLGRANQLKPARHLGASAYKKCETHRGFHSSSGLMIPRRPSSSERRLGVEASCQDRGTTVRSCF